MNLVSRDRATTHWLVAKVIGASPNSAERASISRHSMMHCAQAWRYLCSSARAAHPPLGARKDWSFSRWVWPFVTFVQCKGGRFRVSYSRDHSSA